MAYDVEARQWVAQNPGDGLPPKGWNPTGEPNSYGYDSNGNLMDYVDSRPSYAPGQVEEVWKNASKAWSKDVHGVWQRDPSIPDVVRVRCLDGSFRDVTWDPTVTPRLKRTGPDGWDMGHTQEGKYSKLLDKYLSHKISREKFLEDYHNPENYEVQDPGRNQSHMDE